MEEGRNERIEMKWSAMEEKFFNSALKPGQSIAAEMMKDENGTPDMKIQANSSGEFMAYAMAMMIYKSSYRKEMVELLSAAMVILLDKDESLSDVERLESTIYSFRTVSIIRNEATAELSRKVKEQEITIRNLSAALEILEKNGGSV